MLMLDAQEMVPVTVSKTSATVPETNTVDENSDKIGMVDAACYTAVTNNWRWNKLNNLENNNIYKLFITTW